MTSPAKRTDQPWRFSIDVGGTFTDCIGIPPDGPTQFLKLPSSGLTLGELSKAALHDFVAADRDEPDGFWNGAMCRLLNANGDCILDSQVTGFLQRQNRFTLADPLPSPNKGHSPLRYVLECGLESPVLAIHRMTQTPLGHALPRCIVHLGTTRGTNALLTGNGARTALLITEGFGDLLEVGDQTRPDLFAIDVIKRRSLCERSIEIAERVYRDGTVVTQPDRDTVVDQLQQLRRDGIESLAICFMHAYRFPEHERLVGAWARECGFEEVCLSSETAPLIKLLDRTETTVLDAWLNPVLRDWLNIIDQGLGPGSQLRCMTSAGSLVARNRFSGKDSLLSGPAGGVAGAAAVARRLGYPRAITFDMGGTSTDVSRFDGDFDLQYESEKAGVRVLFPVVSIETVAAGGGSICHCDGTRLLVGPQSAGSFPGPACYGQGGPLTITDVNLLMGRLPPTQFPLPLDLAAAQSRLDEILNQMSEAGHELNANDIMAGFCQIADRHMADAIRMVSLRKGYDPRKYPLIAFGGAAAQHCCSVADNLDIATVIVDRHASILSASGMHLADHGNHQVASIMRPLDASLLAEMPDRVDALERQALQELQRDLPGLNRQDVRVTVSLELRYQGTESTEAVPLQDLAEMEQHFAQRQQHQFGYTQSRPIEAVALRVMAHAAGGQPDALHGESHASPAAAPSPPCESASIWIEDRFCEVPMYAVATLGPEQTLHGPALLVDTMTSTVLLPGWRAQATADQSLRLTRIIYGDGEADEEAATDSTPAASPNSSVPYPRSNAVDPIALELFNRQFVSIADRMGSVLRRNAASVNVRERMDFSCALFDRTGALVVNAPHIPVHLGAMAETVRATIIAHPDAARGDAFVVNDPYAGGSHLPDVTVLTPVFDDGGDEARFWVASRAHHAEIGGIAPGSMPARARTLEEEGVVIESTRIVAAGVPRLKALRTLLATAPWPSRNPDENILDIQAQLAANQSGVNALLTLLADEGAAQTEAYMAHIQDACETLVRQRIAAVPDGCYRYADTMDSGQVIAVSFTVTGDSCVMDFEGTSPVADNNLNANRAIVQSAVMYVLRVLIGADVPLNEGMMKAVAIRLPSCFLNAAPAPDRGKSPPVVGGNVETSQRIVDVLFGALGIAAASQGTMNNWLIGNTRFGYYETVGGGSGGSPTHAGASAVHCHMSNTRLTDPEILETRFPLVLEQFSLRRGSGGEGKHRGGDGMVRQIRFCETLTLSLLTSRRQQGPWGMDGGSAGQPGRNLLITADGQEIELAWRSEVTVNDGDRLRLETPGGGGWGVK